MSGSDNYRTKPWEVYKPPPPKPSKEINCAPAIYLLVCVTMIIISFLVYRWQRKADEQDFFCKEFVLQTTSSIYDTYKCYGKVEEIEDKLFCRCN